MKHTIGGIACRIAYVYPATDINGVFFSITKHNLLSKLKMHNYKSIFTFPTIDA